MPETRFPVAALCSVDIATPDLAGSERFYSDVWGLELAGRADGVTYLAASGSAHHVRALHAGSAPQLLSVTFRAASREDLDNLAASAEAAGATLLAGPKANPGP